MQSIPQCILSAKSQLEAIEEVSVSSPFERDWIDLASASETYPNGRDPSCIRLLSSRLDYFWWG